MLTASHNPPEYNGIKLWQSDGMGFTTDMEMKIERLMTSKDFKVGEGKSKTSDLSQDFLKIFSEMKISKKIRLLVDAGNGAASIIAPKAFESAGYDVVKLNCEPDGNFPNRESEPMPSTLGKAISMVGPKADFGVAYDGDADRVVFIDKQGFMGYNEPLAFAAMLRVMHGQSKKIVTTVETGRTIDLAIEKLGGEVVRTKVGDVFVATETKRSKAAFGCEQCGVYILPEFGYFPSTMYSAAWLIENGIMNMRKELNIHRLYFDKIKIPCGEREKVMEEIAETAKKFEGDVNNIDGLRIDFEDSWILIRPSGTEPVIRIFAEAEDKNRTKYLIQEGRKMVMGK
jgi:phosphoglucosamine mutase